MFEQSEIKHLKRLFTVLGLCCPEILQVVSQEKISLIQLLHIQVVPGHNCILYVQIEREYVYFVGNYVKAILKVQAS